MRQDYCSLKLSRSVMQWLEGSRIAQNCGKLEELMDNLQTPVSVNWPETDYVMGRASGCSGDMPSRKWNNIVPIRLITSWFWCWPILVILSTSAQSCVFFKYESHNAWNMEIQMCQCVLAIWKVKRGWLEISVSKHSSGRNLNQNVGNIARPV